jgi:mRNA-degrading endonuclease RelE of RelBE toxin-antitoxin system
MARKRRKPRNSLEAGGPSRFEIVFAPDAAEDLQRLRACDRAKVREALETHLRHQPSRTSKARVKRLRGLMRPQYRLRVGDDIRVFYDIHGSTVSVLAVIPKQGVREWLEREGITE